MTSLHLLVYTRLEYKLHVYITLAQDAVYTSIQLTSSQITCYLYTRDFAMTLLQFLAYTRFWNDITEVTCYTGDFGMTLLKLLVIQDTLE